MFGVSADLLAVLKWKSEPDKIGLHLQKLMSLNGEEIVKVSQHREQFCDVRKQTNNSTIQHVWKSLEVK